jgi:hypothetical protein
VLAEVPVAAIKTYLKQRKPPPPLVDELISKTYEAIVGSKKSGEGLVARMRYSN